ncbi:MAG: class II fructose-bisphosphate aldolase family protein [Defluviitaleaceae bacterium]|nr:class II fructose-bisphosphate aldolase family protein [Defluviitaleaceae bacterium]
MPLCTTVRMLKEAKEIQTAVGAFNVENMEMAQAVISAAEEMGCPVILQTSSSAARYAPMPVFAAMIAAMAELATVPVALHLDHADEALVHEALKSGYTSVMYDGSKKSFSENVNRTKAIVSAAEALNIPVEGELGGIGGKEDDVECQIDYTDPAEAADFVAQTGVNSLAVAIGTMHGVYKTTPKLDIQRLEAISAVVDVPLVLHGASGLSTIDLQNCIKAGICKINFGTDLRIAYTQSIRDYMEQNPNKFDPRAYGKVARERVTEIVKKKLVITSNIILES